MALAFQCFCSSMEVYVNSEGFSDKRPARDVYGSCSKAGGRADWVGCAARPVLGPRKEAALAPGDWTFTDVGQPGGHRWNQSSLVGCGLGCRVLADGTRVETAILVSIKFTALNRQHGSFCPSSPRSCL